jgi:hypothetical protein
MNAKQLVERKLAGETEVLRYNLTESTINLTLLDLGLNLGRRQEAINFMSSGTGLCRYIFLCMEI